MPKLSRRLALSLAALAAVLLAAILVTPAREGLARAAGIGSADKCLTFPPPATPAGARPPAAATSGQLLVAHDWAGDASVLDLATGVATYIRVGLRDPHEAAVSDDGRWGILTDFGRQVRGKFDGNRAAVIDMRTKRVARVIDLGEARGAHGVAFIPGTHRAVITTQTSRRVVEVDAARGTVVSSIDTRADGSHLLTVAPDGRTVFTVNEGNGTVSRLDLARRAFAAQYPVAPEQAEGIAITPDGRELWVGSRSGGFVRILDPARGTVLATLEAFDTPDRIAISRDGRRALITSQGCSSLVVDVPGRRAIGSIPDVYAGGIHGPDGRVAFAAHRRGGIMVIDLETRRVIARHALRERPHGIAWGPKP